jgi:N-formylglutamate deformylase
MANQLILNIPHASTFIPKEDLESVFLVHGKDLKKELLNMTDWYTDELFVHGIGKEVVAKVSRLVCDTERFSHDDQESMSEKGMGFCYRRGYNNEEIKDFSTNYQDEVLWRYYAPHHIALTDAVQESLNANDSALILDCHSFSDIPLPYEPNQDDRPDICIGTDDYHTPQKLTDYVMHYFERQGYSVAINSPYSGSIVPLRYYQKDERVKSIMVEVNRRLYLEPGTNKKNARFKDIRDDLHYLEENLKDWYPGKKVWFCGLAKPSNPIFSQGVFFATPVFLRDLDKLKTDDSDRLQTQKDAT